MNHIGFLIVLNLTIASGNGIDSNPSPPAKRGNILFWMPAVAKSMAMSLTQLANALSRRGHNVTAVVTAGLDVPWHGAVEVFEAESGYMGIWADYSREVLRDGVTSGPPLQRILQETVVASDGVLSKPAFREVIDKRKARSSVLRDEVTCATLLYSYMVTHQNEKTSH